jgi:hypothetical protein
LLPTLRSLWKDQMFWPSLFLPILVRLPIGNNLPD